MDEHERELWRQADRILDTLLDLDDPQREARLLAMTSDEAVRKRVRRLLHAHAAPPGLLDAPLPGFAADKPSELGGQRLGRWRLIEEIGRGGMAVVYRAVAEDGAEGQLAAVKVLTLGSLAQAGRERFLQEQQALLRLRHPYIAALHDAGVAADGTPWLAMALVEGEPIDRWCRARHLDAAARVERVLEVCEALDYSHRNLVVHRDIKPSNVLVGDDGHVRVLDFGIARLLGENDSAHTRTQLRALTPEYAAPEQFAGAPPSTAMDVYGIGALLYRLLAGAPPQHGAQGTITAPSRRLRAQAGAQAPAELRQRIKRLRGDLDTIVMKALAGRPEDRYTGVAALADDLRRWLAHRPIRARAPSLRYRLRKFAARNRWQVAAAATVLLALVAGIGGVLWQAERARDAAEESRAQLNYTSRVLEALAPSTEEARELDRSRLIAEAAERARAELAGKPRLLASVELDLGGIAERVGDNAQALALYDHAYGLRRAAFGEDSIETAMALARTGALRGRLDPPQPGEAERRLRRAEAQLRQRASASPAWIDAAQELAIVLGEQDRYAEAQALLREAAQACTGAQPPDSCERAWMAQGSLWARMQSDIDAAIAAYGKAHAARVARLGAEHADTLFVTTLLGELYHRNGQRQRGLALLEQVYAAQRRIYAKPTEQLLTTLQKLAIAVAGEGRNERALALRQEHLAQARQLFGDRHPAVALSYADLGSLLFSETRFAEAEQAQRRAYVIYADYAGAGGAGALIVQSNLAEALREQGRADEARPLAQQTVAGMEKLFGPDSVHVAGRLVTLARIESDLGAAAQAQAHAERAIAIFRATPSPGNTALEGARAARARVLLAAGRAGEAEAELREVLRAIDASPGRTERAHWETFAALTEAACAARAADCPQLRDAVRAALAQSMPAIAHKRLRDALAAQ